MAYSSFSKNTTYESICIIVSLLIGTCSFCYSLQSGESHWFQRSGSLIVLFALMAEYSNYNVQLAINSEATRGAGAIGGGVGSLKQSKTRTVLSWITHILAITGTIIWGYGDLFIIAT